MSEQSFKEVTYALQFLGILIVVLLVLLVLVRILVRILRRMAMHRVSLTDQDLIGQEAVVIKTVRSSRPGNIVCEWQGDKLTGSAVSDRIIRPGQKVLITATDRGVYRVRSIEETNRQSSAGRPV